MLIYRGRELNISEDFQKKFEEKMFIPLNEIEIDAFLSMALDITPSISGILEPYSNEFLTKTIIECAEKDMSIM